MGGDVRVVLCLVLAAATTPGVAVEGPDPPRTPQQEVHAPRGGTGGRTTEGRLLSTVPPVVDSATNPSDVLTTVTDVVIIVDTVTDSVVLQSNVTTLDGARDSVVGPTVPEAVTTVDSATYGVGPTMPGGVTTVDSATDGRDTGLLEPLDITAVEGVTNIGVTVTSAQDVVTAVDNVLYGEDVVPGAPGAVVTTGDVTGDEDIIPTVEYDITIVDVTDGGDLEPTVPVGVVTTVDDVLPTMPGDVVTTVDDVLPTVPGDEVTTVDDVLPTVPGDVVTTVDDVLPTVPGDVVTTVDDVLPTVPGDEVTTVDDVLPTVPGDVVTTVDDVLPTVPGDVVTTVDDVLPTVPGDEVTTVDDVLPTVPGDVVTTVDDVLPTVPGDEVTTVDVIGGGELETSVGTSLSDTTAVEDLENSEVTRGQHGSPWQAVTWASSLSLEDGSSTSDPALPPTTARHPGDVSGASEGGHQPPAAHLLAQDDLEEYDLILETVTSTTTLYLHGSVPSISTQQEEAWSLHEVGPRTSTQQEEEPWSLQELGPSRRLPRTVSPDLLGTAASMNQVMVGREEYRGFPPPSLSTFLTVASSSRSPADLRRSDPEPDIDDIIQGIVQLLGGNVKVTAADHPNTRLTTFTSGPGQHLTSSRINNRGPPRLTKMPFGVLTSVLHSHPPFRPPITPPATPAHLPGRPQFVANTRPPFMVPLPPSLAARPPPPLQRPYATGIPLPVDLLPPPGHEAHGSPGVVVNPAIPGFPDTGGQAVATHPVPPTSHPTPTLDTPTTPTSSPGTPTPSADASTPPTSSFDVSTPATSSADVPRKPATSSVDVTPADVPTPATSSADVPIPATSSVDVPIAATSSVDVPIAATSSVDVPISATSSSDAASDSITTFITIAQTTSLGTLSSTTNLVTQLVSGGGEMSSSSRPSVVEASPSSRRPEGVADGSRHPPGPGHTSTAAGATTETRLQPSLPEPSSTSITPTPAGGEEPQAASTVQGPPTAGPRPSATPPPLAPTPSLSRHQPPRPSYPALARPRPGVVLDDSNYRPGQIITGTVVPYDLGGAGDIFDVTVSAHQGFGGSPLSPSQNLPPSPGLRQPPAPGGVLGPLLTSATDHHDAFVSIDGRKTYFSLFPTATQALGTPQGGTVGTGVGVVIPEEDLPLGEQPGYYPAHATPPRPTRPPPTHPPRPHPPTHPPRPRPPTQPPPPPTQPPTRPTRKPYTRRPTQPAIRIDTCIVGDDSTCQEKLGEVCRTEEEVSSCFCRPGTARRRPRTPCKRMVSLQVSLKVDRVGDQRIVWGGNYGNPESDEFRLLKWEARHAISNAMSKTPMGSAYLGNTVHKFYSLGGKVIVNSTINLEDLPTTRNRNIRQTLQRQIIQVIQSHANNIGNSALWVDGPLNPVPDVSDVNECGDASLHDCHPHAICINQFGTFTCRCLPGYTDRFSDDPEQVGRRCETCSSDYCNKRGECGIKDGHKVCQCRGSYYGKRCEIDGEVLGVAVGASVAAVVIIILTLIFLCMWSRRWKAQDRKTEVLARGAAGATLGGFAVNVQHKGASGQQYGVTLEDRMRWAQLADTLSNQNIYAQQQQSEAVGGMYTANSSDYLTSAATSANPFSIYNRVTRALSNSTLAGREGGFFDRLRKLFGGSKTTKDHRSSYMMTPQPNITFQQLIALHAQLAAQPEQLRGAGGPSVPPPTAPTPTPLFQHQRQVGASSSGYASLGTLGSTSGGHYGHQLSHQQFGLQHLNPMSHLISMQQQQSQQQQHHHRHKHGFGTQSTYGQFGPSSLNTLSAQGGVSRAPTLGARTPLPLHDVTGAATIGPMGGASVAPAGMLENSEEEVERPYHLPRPKSRGSLGDASDIYYEPDDLTATRGPPDRPPPPVPRSSHPQTYNFSFLH